MEEKDQGIQEGQQAPLNFCVAEISSFYLYKYIDQLKKIRRYLMEPMHYTHPTKPAIPVIDIEIGSSPDISPSALATERAIETLVNNGYMEKYNSFTKALNDYKAIDKKNCQLVKLSLIALGSMEGLTFVENTNMLNELNATAKSYDELKLKHPIFPLILKELDYTKVQDMNARVKALSDFNKSLIIRCSALFNATYPLLEKRLELASKNPADSTTKKITQAMDDLLKIEPAEPLIPVIMNRMKKHFKSLQEIDQKKADTLSNEDLKTFNEIKKYHEDNALSTSTFLKMKYDDNSELQADTQRLLSKFDTNVYIKKVQNTLQKEVRELYAKLNDYFIDLNSTASVSTTDFETSKETAEEKIKKYVELYWNEDLRKHAQSLLTQYNTQQEAFNKRKAENLPTKVVKEVFDTKYFYNTAMANQLNKNYEKTAKSIHSELAEAQKKLESTWKMVVDLDIKLVDLIKSSVSGLGKGTGPRTDSVWRIRSWWGSTTDHVISLFQQKEPTQKPADNNNSNN